MIGPNPADWYARAAERATQLARGVHPEQLTDPTPCSEWTVQNLLDHLADGTAYLAAALGRPDASVPNPATAEDLAVGFASCRQLLQDPANLEHRSMSPLGFEWSGMEATAGTFMDVLIHTWDLATATGQDPQLDPELVDACVAMFLPDMPERGRAGGIVGPAVEVGPNASAQDRLLGAMGRTP